MPSLGSIARFFCRVCKDSYPWGAMFNVHTCETCAAKRYTDASNGFLKGQ